MLDNLRLRPTSSLPSFDTRQPAMIHCDSLQLCHGRFCRAPRDLLKMAVNVPAQIRIDRLKDGIGCL